MQKNLVVEDDFDIQELLQNFLQEAGYEVTTASDGIEAITVFSDKQFDLIMPKRKEHFQVLFLKVFFSVMGLFSQPRIGD